MKKSMVMAGAVATAIFVSGCASIVSKSRYPVNINSNPTGASVTIKNKWGHDLQRVTTPSVVMLDAGDGFFSRARYQIQFEKEGYQPMTAFLSADLSGWYWGNLIFGGLLGMLIVDPATGAMWKLDPYVNGVMQPMAKPVTEGRQ